MIGGFVVDGPELIFLYIALGFSLWAVLDTERLLWPLSYLALSAFASWRLAMSD